MRSPRGGEEDTVSRTAPTVATVAPTTAIGVGQIVHKAVQFVLAVHANAPHMQSMNQGDHWSRPGGRA